MKLPRKKENFYKIVITINNKVYKEISNKKKLDTINQTYLKEINKSNKIKCKKNFIHNYNEINNANIYINLITTDKLYSSEPFIIPGYYVIKKQRFNLVEKYHLKYLNKRLTYNEIININVIDPFIIYLLKHNKILIISGITIKEIIVCKTPDDANILFHMLRDDLNKKILFLKKYDNSFKKRILHPLLNKNNYKNNFYSNNKKFKVVYL